MTEQASIVGSQVQADLTELYISEGVIAEGLGDLQQICGDDAQLAGWRSDRPTPEEYGTHYAEAIANWRLAKIGLMHTELSEAVEELRKKGGTARRVYYVTPDGEQHVRPVFDRQGVMISKPEGVPTELADTVIRIMDLCDVEGIDLGAAIVQKLVFNRGRGFKHGGKVL